MHTADTVDTAVDTAEHRRTRARRRMGAAARARLVVVPQLEHHALGRRVDNRQHDDLAGGEERKRAH